LTDSNKCSVTKSIRTDQNPQFHQRESIKFYIYKRRIKTVVSRSQNLRHLYWLHPMRKGLSTGCSWNGPMGRMQSFSDSFFPKNRRLRWM